MRSTTRLPRTGRVFIALVTVMLVLPPVSGCSWAKRMGEKLPVSGSANRCEGRWFCFSDEAQTEMAANAEAKRRVANPDMQQSAEMSVPPAAMLPSGMVPPPGMPPQGVPPEAMPQDSAAPLPVYRLPKNAEEAKTMSYPQAGMPGIDMPPGMEAPQQQKAIPGLKPYEQNLPEMKNLEPVPLIEQMRQDMDW